MAPEPEWQVLGFDDCMDLWIHTQNPPDELCILVANWLVARIENPHVGVRRRPDFPNQWFGKVTNSDHGSGAAVYCTYDLDEAEKIVYIRAISTLTGMVH